jgi:hypothetical protein
LLKRFKDALKEVTDPEARWEESDLDKYEFKTGGETTNE